MNNVINHMENHTMDHTIPTWGSDPLFTQIENKKLRTPYFLIDEERLIKNLEILKAEGEK